MVKKGYKNIDLIDEVPETFVRYHKGLEKVRFEVEKAEAMKWRNITVIIYWGESGVGKTRKVFDDYGYENVYTLDNTGTKALWYDGYEGQKVLLIDDFYGWIDYGIMLRILDGYPYRGPVKGSFTWAQWDTVIITSNRPPKTWYPTGLTPAFHRRIYRCYKVTKLGVILDPNFVPTSDHRDDADLFA